jgi:hypothetical protein
VIGLQFGTIAALLPHFGYDVVLGKVYAGQSVSATVADIRPTSMLVSPHINPA